MSFEKRKFLTSVLMLVLLVPIITSSIKIAPAMGQEYPSAELTGSISDQGVDIDGNGLFNYLEIGVEVNVTAVGYYFVALSGLLNDYGDPIPVWDDNYTYLDVGKYFVYLQLHGPTIYASRLNPTNISSIGLYDEYGNWLGSLYYVPLSKQYNYTEFDARATLTGVITDSGVDTDGNGLFNYLEIGVEVNVTTAGYYRVPLSGLLDENGTWIGVWNDNYTYLDVEKQFVYFQLGGPTIYASGLNASYVSSIGLYDEYGNWLGSLSSVPLSRTYNYTEFDAPPSPPAAVAVSASDITEDSLKLVWTESTDPDFARYEIWQSTIQGVLGTSIAVITSRSTTSLTVSGLTSGTTYYFTVRVVDTDGLYADSTQFSVTTAMPPLWQTASADIVFTVYPDGQVKVGGSFEAVLEQMPMAVDVFVRVAENERVARIRVELPPEVASQFPYNASTVSLLINYVNDLINENLNATVKLPEIIASQFPFNATNLTISVEHLDGDLDVSIDGAMNVNLTKILRTMLGMFVGFNQSFDFPVVIQLDYSRGEYEGSIVLHLLPGLPVGDLEISVTGNLTDISLNGTSTVIYGEYFGMVINRTAIDQIEGYAETTFNASIDTPNSLLNVTKGRLSCPYINIERKDITGGEEVTFEVRIHGDFIGQLISFDPYPYLPIQIPLGEYYDFLYNLLNDTLHKIEDASIDISYTPTDTMLYFTLIGTSHLEDIVEQISEAMITDGLPPDIESTIWPIIEGIKQCVRSNLNSTIDITYNSDDRTVTLTGESWDDKKMLIDGLSRLPADILYSIGTMLNLPIPLVTPGADVTNTGTLGFGYSVDGSIIALMTPEGMIGEDLNGDSDMADYVIRYYNMTDGTTTNTGVVGFIPRISGSIIALMTPEGMIGEDLNGDSDMADYVIRYYNMTDGTTTNTGADGIMPTISGNIIAFYIDERMVGSDLNGDGDTYDSIIRFYDIASGTTSSTEIIGYMPWVSNDIIAFSTDESWVGEDLNDDDDTFDQVIRYYNITDGTVENTKATGFAPIISGEIIAFITYESMLGTDLNFDGDTMDYVIRYYNITDGTITNTGATGYLASMKDDIIAFYTPEHMIGRWGLNQDGDTNDYVIRYYNMTSHRVINTGVAGYLPQISNGIMIFSTPESMIGEDLNGDNDMADIVIRYSTIPELPEMKTEWAHLSISYADQKIDANVSMSLESDINEAANFLKDAFLFNIMTQTWSPEMRFLYETKLDISDFKLGFKLNQTYAGGYIDSVGLSPFTDPINATAFKLERFFNLTRNLTFPGGNEALSVTIVGGSNSTHKVVLYKATGVPPPDTVLKDALNRTALMTWTNITLSSLKNLEFIIVPGVQTGGVIHEPEKVTPENPIIINGTETLGMLINITGVSDKVSVILSNVTLPEDVAPPPGTWKVLGNYIQISVSDESVSVNATIRMDYADEWLSETGVVESTLTIYRWNGTDWIPIKPSHVNAEENYVWVNVNQFSIFALMGDVRPIAVTLSISDVTENSLKLTWTANADPDFDRYEIFQSTTSVDLGTSIANETNQATTSLTVTGLSSGTTYYFTIRVWDTVGLSTDSTQNVTTALPIWQQPWFIGLIAAVIVVVAVVVVLVLRRKGTAST